MFIREKQFYKTFFTLTLMMAAQNIVAVGVNLADNIMLGRYSETSLAAASLVNQIQYLLQMISVAGVGTGALAMVSQYWGKRELEPIRRIIALAMKFAAVVGLLFFSITFFFPKNVMRVLTNQPAIQAEGVIYLRIMCFTYLTFPLQSMITMSLRGVRTIIIGPVVSAISLITNILLNYMFIFGNWGAAEMGIHGAAVATLIARILELFIVLIYVRFIDQKLRLRIFSFFKPDAHYLRDFARAAFPVIASGASWGIGMTIQTMILGHLGETVIAANSIAIVVYQIITVYAHGACNTSSVMMGNAIGAGQMDRIRPYARTFQLLFVINGVVTGLVLFLARDLILNMYILAENTRELAHSFMVIMSVVAMFAAYEYPVQCGIILGGGNTRYAFIVDTLFVWFFMLPLSALSAFVWKLSPIITFIILKADQFLKCIPNGIVVNRYRWVRILTREEVAASEDLTNSSNNI